MSASQVGKIEALLNCIGFHISHDSAPILVIQPTGTGGMADSFAKDRLALMLRDTPALKGKVKDPRSRDSNNATLQKKFPGGHITIVGANTPAALASRPIRICLFDEADLYPASAGSEGDPIQLALKCAATFWNRKVVTLGDAGVAVAAENWCELYPAPATDVVNVNGAGEGFAAGILDGLLDATPLADAVRRGLAAARLNAQSSDTCSAEIYAARLVQP